MKLKLQNNWTYKGNGRWDWEIYLVDNNSGKLKDIVSVDYRLHPTFPKPRRIKNNKQDNFKLKTNGWGTFVVKAYAITNTGEKIEMDHLITLKENPKYGTSK